MFVTLILVAFLSTLCSCQQVENVGVTAEEYKFDSPQYPEEAPAGLDLTWNFSAEPDKQIIFKCFELTTTRPDPWYPCGSGSVMRVDDGTGMQELCGRYHGYYKLTNGPRLTVRFQTGPSPSGRFSCTVRANVKTRVETHDIQLEDKVFLIDGRAERFADLTWNIMTDPGTKIRLNCGSMGTYQTTPCSSDKILIEDANNIREFCGSNEVHFDTDSTLVTIKLLTDVYPGFVSCYATKLKPVQDEVIHLELGQPAYTNIIKNSDPYFNKTWTFTTRGEGVQIAISCPDIRYGQLKHCRDDHYAVDDGTGEQIACAEASGTAFFSKNQKITFRVQSGPYGSGNIRCLAQAVDGPNPDQYINIVSKEVDSDEHGRENGPKRTNCRCGWANKGANARVLHGKDAEPNEYPWMVAIRDYSGFYFCGGSILTQWHVLTATHCLYQRENVDLYAVVGEHDISVDDKDKSAKAIKIAKRFFASGYSNTTFTNDIAVVVLSEKLEFNNKVGPICLTPNRLNLDNQYILAMGWGTTHDKYQSAILQKAYVRVVDINICDAKYGFSFKENGVYHKVCYHSKTRDTCSGDSGGPLVWLDPETNRYTQVSLVSFSHACGYVTPAVSTEVSYFYNWIQSIIKETYPGEQTCHKL
uniref:Venom s1 protease with cub domain 19 n=1 Tax=Pristhesancus plagipennis TaxID=1955184 RepID=A0A1Q1NPI3_PRIPG|nr:venom s1 protease with cub domain 19 [Pristhesancus plagipennis]